VNPPLTGRGKRWRLYLRTSVYILALLAGTAVLIRGLSDLEIYPIDGVLLILFAMALLLHCTHRFLDLYTDLSETFSRHP
jgi:hypothetical protein